MAQEEGGGATSLPAPLIEEPKLEEGIIKEEEILIAPETKLQLTQKIEESENKINNLEKEVNYLKKWGVGAIVVSVISLILALYSLARSKRSL